ncbi:SAM-dependent methyltransferase [Candidatus Burkholderia humilis]|nr:SAM-dependent methyltransferase [Candidatus Burkholderia humilis]
MSFPKRLVAFVLAASNRGTMIVNRNDYAVENNRMFGVGGQILESSCFDADEVGFVLTLLNLRRRYFGDGMFAIDGGANIGVYTIEWARHMQGWGKVLSFEAQEVVYYALAGNIAINNCLNVRAKLAALGETVGELTIPQPNYFAPASYGSLELRQRATTQYIGQDISYAAEAGVTVPMVSIDSLKIERLDFLKLDVEGMEMDVLKGAAETIKRCKPIMLIEYIKSDLNTIKQFIEPLGYKTSFETSPNLITFHDDDRSCEHLQLRENSLIANP